MSDAATRLFNVNTFIRVEGAHCFINCREHLWGFFHFQSRIDLDQAAEDGLPFACVQSGQFLEDFPYAHGSKTTTAGQRRQRSFHSPIAQTYGVQSVASSNRGERVLTEELLQLGVKLRGVFLSGPLDFRRMLSVITAKKLRRDSMSRHY